MPALSHTAALRRIVAVAGVLALSGAFVACAADDTGDGAHPDGPVTVSMLVPAGADETLAKAYADAFHAENEDITIKVETRPTGADGENVVKTRLATGEMDDIFVFNSGSLLSSLSPDKSLLDISDQKFMDRISDDFVSVVSGDEGAYGVPWGSSRAGGIMYNKAVYKKLGLEVPETWNQFEQNNKVIADAGLVPVVQTYADSFTAQLPILADFANLSAVDPDWADEYTKNNRSYAEKPALESFQKLADLAKAGAFNKDFASAKYDDGIRMVAQGEAAHYPMLTNYVATNVAANYPDTAEDVGFFAMPSSWSDTAKMTMWMPLAAYVSRSIPADHRDAAMKFLDFIASPEGCQTYAEAASPAGPYLIEGCSVPDSALPFVHEVASYVEAGNSALALEFLSPVKGTNLPQFSVEVGSGISSAEKAASDYDNDVAKQAKQLNLPGW